MWMMLLGILLGLIIGGLWMFISLAKAVMR